MRLRLEELNSHDHKRIEGRRQRQARLSPRCQICHRRGVMSPREFARDEDEGFVSIDHDEPVISGYASKRKTLIFDDVRVRVAPSP